MSPRAIICGEWLDQEKHLCLQFGEYCQVYEEKLPRNSNKPRMLGAVCIGPTHNEQGGFNSGWSLPSLLTLAITNNGIGIVSHPYLVTAAPVVKLMNLKPPC